MGKPYGKLILVFVVVNTAGDILVELSRRNPFAGVQAILLRLPVVTLN